MLTVLDQSPEKVVWAYEIAFHMRGSKVPSQYRQLVLGLEAGREVAMWTPSHEVVNQLLDAVREHCPTATVGFSDELAKRFQENPASLRRT